MNFDKIFQLLKTNTTVKLITADNAPLILSFLFQSFKQNQGIYQSDTILEKELIAQLADHLYLINHEENLYPRQPKQYLTDWTNAGFLRKYPAKNDDFLYELTPATENAFKWIDSLDKKEFIGTESRLKHLFERLKELSTKSERDDTLRIKELEAKKRSIEQEIANIRLGKMDVLDDRQIKEQYFIIEETAKYLLADFRQVEQNFRDLDRKFRQKIITTSQVKGDVLADLFQQQDYLYETDQGKSFIAFWEFLLSQSKQEEFDQLIEEVINIPIVKQLQQENFKIANVRNNLIEAGDKIQKSTNSLLEQLRKYLEHKSFFENKRIHDNINESLKLISENPGLDFTKLDVIWLDNIIDVDLILEKPLYTPPEKIKFINRNPEEGIIVQQDTRLFDQFEINMNDLRENIKSALKNRSQISLPDFIKEYEIQKGVAEIVAYVEIASKENNRHIINDDQFDIIEVRNNKTEKNFKIKIPQIIFCK